MKDLMRVAFRTARSTPLVALRSDGEVTFLYRGRALCCLPLSSLSDIEGLHLTADADPRFWVDRQSLEFVLSMLEPP